MTGCLAEETCSVYVDGELSAEDVRVVESHLSRCVSCRALVRALREEADVLSDAVLDRPLERVSPTPARARAAGLAIGLVPTLAIAALAVTTLGWLMEIGLPTGAGWLSPLNLIGVYEVTFDVLSLLRNRGSGLLDFAIWLGANLSVGVILIVLVRELGRRVVDTVAPLALVVAALLVGPQVARALELRTGDEDVQIAAGETIEDTVFISGDTITIDGTIEGDLAVVGERILVRGTVLGNVFAAAGEVEVSGTVEGSLYAAGRRVTVEGRVLQSAYGAAETFTIHQNANVGRDALLVGESVHMDGTLARDLFSAAERVDIRGSVGRDASTRGNRLALHDGASIGGDLVYRLGAGEEAQIGPTARVGGATTRGEPLADDEPENRWLTGAFYMSRAVFLVSAFLVGLLLHLAVPQLFGADLERSGDFFRALGYGALALFGTPIALVLCLVTVVGIPVGVIGLFLYLTSLFVSVVVVAALVGTSITALVGFEPTDVGFGITLLVGLVVVLVAMNLPFVGGLLRLLVVLTGLGLLVVTAIDAWRGREGPPFGAGYEFNA